MKTKYVEKSTQTSHDVCLQILEVGVIRGSQKKKKKKIYSFKVEDV